MNHPPPLPRERQIVDIEHLKMLAIFHFVVAGLAFLGLAGLLVHFVIFKTIFSNPELWKNSPNPPPVQFMQIFQWFYLAMGTFLLCAALGNLLGGLFIRARKHRVFSFVVAALNCIQIPFGTVLGVFTIIVLSRESVRELYESSGPPRD